MARARNIKPGFFKNEDLAELAFEVRLLFIGLWTLADREGRLEDRPKRIRMEIFPGDDVDVGSGLDALAGRGLIRRYEVEGIAYIDIPTFSTHQNPHQREAASTIPAFQGTTKAQPRHDQGTTKAQASPADSLNPDSLNPENPIVGQTPPDDSHRAADKAEKQARRDAAVRVLAFLNEKCGRAFEAVEKTLAPIEARLKEGYTEGQCRQVIVRKLDQWGDNPRMTPFLRPKTLFGPENFANYRGELVVPKETQNA